MMGKLLLMLATFCNGSGAIFAGIYTRKNQNNKDATSLYTLLLLLTATIGWGVMLLFNRSYDYSVLIFSLAFGISYTLAQIGTIQSIKYGMVSLSSLILNFSLIFTVLWGILFWNDKFTLKIGFGIALVMISIYLCVFTNTKDEENKTFSFKWFISIIIAFIGSAGCPIVQKTQQLRYHGKYGEFLMFFAMLFSLLSCFVMVLLKKPKETKKVLSKTGYLPVLSAAFNVLLNLITIDLANRRDIPTSFVYPTIAIGGLSLALLLSLICFKEKLTKRQVVGIMIGALAIYLLS